MFSQPLRIRPRAGLTLIELMIVVAILALLAGTIVSLGAGYITYANDKAARASLGVIRDAIMGTTEKPGFYSDIGRAPNSITELLSSAPPVGVSQFDRDTQLGWRGPYLINSGGVYDLSKLDSSFTTDFGINLSVAQTDSWQDPIIIQRLRVSAFNLYFTDASGIERLVGTTGELDGDYTRVISAGPNHRIDTQLSDPTATARGDDLVLFIRRSDSHP